MKPKIKKVMGSEVLPKDYGFCGNKFLISSTFCLQESRSSDRVTLTCASSLSTSQIVFFSFLNVVHSFQICKATKSESKRD